MIDFEPYIEYIRQSFKDYTRCLVKQKVKTDYTEIIVIVPSVYPPRPLTFGELGIKFDEDTIGFFGDFFSDDYIDWDDNSWEKYSKEEILQLLDEKIVEYKHYIDYGYFFAFYDKNNDRQRLWPYVYTGDINKIDYKAVYLDQRTRDEISYDQIKSVTVSNFYGDIIVDNKILN